VLIVLVVIVFLVGRYTLLQLLASTKWLAERLGL